MTSLATICEKEKLWQKKVYRRMTEYPEGRGITSFGEFANENRDKHLLTKKQSEYKFITREIHQAALNKFEHHKAV